jgi:seryl-tRNA synthetase
MFNDIDGEEELINKEIESLRKKRKRLIERRNKEKSQGSTFASTRRSIEKIRHEIDELQRELKSVTNDAIQYMVMAEALNNGTPQIGRKPWVVFKTEDKQSALNFVIKENAKRKTMVGQSTNYYLSK